MTPYLVGIDGRAGTGKTTLADVLAEHLARGGADVAVVHLDEVYPGWDGLAAAVPVLVRDVLQPLRAGRPARWRLWDWAADAPALDAPGGWTARGPAAAVVVEGVGAGARPCRPHLDHLLWLDAPARRRYERAIGRDGEAFAREWDRWAAQEDAYLATDDPAAAADVVVRT